MQHSIQHQIEEDELDCEPNTIGPSTNVKLGLVISIAVGLTWVGWVTSELNTIKNALVARSAALDTIQTEVKLMERRMEDLEQRGSKPMQDLQKSVDKISEELRVHELITKQFINSSQTKP